MIAFAQGIIIKHTADGANRPLVSDRINRMDRITKFTKANLLWDQFPGGYPVPRFLRGYDRNP